MRIWMSILLAAVVVIVVTVLLFSMPTKELPAPQQNTGEPVQPQDNRTTVLSATMDAPVQLTAQFFRPAELTVRKGDTVNLMITSVDKNHSVFITSNSTTVRVPRGEKTRVTLAPQNDVQVQCNDLCDAGVTLTIHVQ